LGAAGFLVRKPEGLRPYNAAIGHEGEGERRGAAGFLEHLLGSSPTLLDRGKVGVGRPVAACSQEECTEEGVEQAGDKRASGK